MAERAGFTDVQAKALETAYRLDAYSMYGGTEAGAVRALKRRCPGWRKDELAALLRQALRVQKAAQAWLQANEDDVRQWFRTSDQDDMTTVAQSFCVAHADWPERELAGLLAINFLYFYLM